MAEGHLVTSSDGYGVLKLGERCRALLRNEATLSMRRPSANALAQRPAGGGRAGRSRGEAASRLRDLQAGMSERDKALFEQLKALRRRLADAESVPPYVVCHDRSLLEIVDKKPGDLSALEGITGLGKAKITRYGTAILETLSED